MSSAKHFYMKKQRVKCWWNEHMFGNFTSTFYVHIFWVNVVSAAFPTYMQLEKSCQNNVCSKNLRIKCWWNWHLTSLFITYMYKVANFLTNYSLLKDKNEWKTVWPNSVWYALFSPKLQSSKTCFIQMWPFSWYAFENPILGTRQRDAKEKNRSFSIKFLRFKQHTECVKDLDQCFSTFFESRNLLQIYYHLWEPKRSM